jgi:hypothetical protein
MGKQVFDYVKRNILGSNVSADKVLCRIFKG